MIEYTHHTTFRDWSEFVSFVLNKPQAKNATSHREDPWNGTNTWEEAINFLTHGWPVALKQLDLHKPSEETLNKIIAVADYEKIMNMSPMPGDCSIINIPAVIADQPDQYINETAGPKIVKGSRLITMLIQSNHNSQTPHTSYFKRGAMLYHIIERLETVGYSVRVIGIYASKNTEKPKALGDLHIIEIPFKEFDELLDPTKLACNLCASFMHRRFVFHVKEHQPSDTRKKFGYHSGGGYSFVYSGLQDKSLIKSIDPTDDILWFNQPTKQEDIPQRINERFKDTTEG